MPEYLFLDYNNSQREVKEFSNDREAAEYCDSDFFWRKKKTSDFEEQEYAKTEWPYKYAKRWYDIMQRLGWLTSTQTENIESTLQDWADQFDKVIRTGKGTREDLDNVLQWLFKEDDFWIREGAIRSPRKFHSRTNEGEWYFEYFKMHASRDEEQKLPLPNEGTVVPEKKYEKYKEVYDNIEDRFAKVGVDKHNTDLGIYKFKG